MVRKGLISIEYSCKKERIYDEKRLAKYRVQLLKKRINGEKRFVKHIVQQ